ncbi:MAG: hypothetical protein HWE18_03860 [Gammaproteobacteria bacterium]|nr:hypothetical protein [Gammaproteobacteria bacterium]
MNKLQLIMVLGVILAAGLTWQLASMPKLDTAEQANPTSTPAVSTIETTQPATSHPNNDELSELNPSDAEQASWLEHPNVKAYFARQEQKQTIKEYFDNPAGHDPQAIYELIEKIESEGRMVAFEALSLKLAWLEKNTTDKATFQAKSQAIIDAYKQKAQAMNDAYQPEDIPGFTQYKAQEKRIIAEVNAMTQFPEGHNKQSYLRERLLQARILAYGEGSI